jgi:hypothetical protein
MTDQEKINKLRAALVGFIGMDGEQELTIMRASVVAMTELGAPPEDVTVSLAAIDALLETLPTE